MTEDDMDELVMYTTTWCGWCVRLKRALDADGIPYREVNIEDDDAAADFVMRVNGGNQTVPTVRFPDGSAVTNPNIFLIRQKLADTA